jgi:lysine 2,3-aminomutase
MSNKSIMERYTFERFKADAGRIIPLVEQASSVEEARRALFSHVSDEQYERCGVGINSNAALPHIVRDCARVWRSILLQRSEKAAGFSIVQALWDLTRGKPRPDLEPGFYAELTHLSLGLEGNVAVPESEVSTASTSLSGREAAWFVQENWINCGRSSKPGCPATKMDLNERPYVVVPKDGRKYWLP